MPGPISGPMQAPPAIQGAYVDSAFSTAESFVEGQTEIADQLKTCPSCGSERYHQRPATKRHPADTAATDETS